MKRNLTSVFFQGARMLIGCMILNLILLSCGSKTNFSAPSNSFVIDTINIEIDSTFLGEYSESDIVFSASNETQYFFARNGKKHQIDVIDLLNHKQLDPIKLEKQGPDGIFGFDDFVYYQDMFVFWKSSIGELVFIDWQGKIIDKYNFKDKLTELDDKLTFLRIGAGAGGVMIKRQGMHRVLQAVDNTFFIPIYCQCIKNEADYYKNPVFATFNLDQNLFQIHKSHYPSEFVDGNFHGDHDQYSVFSWNDKLYANFGYSPNIFHVSPNDLSEIKIQGPYEYPLTPTISWSDYNTLKLYSRHFDSYQFGAIKTDPYRNCLIRPHKYAEYSKSSFVLPAKTKMIISFIDPKSWSELYNIELDFYNTFSINEVGLTIPIGFKIINDENFFSFIQIEL